MKAGGEVTWPRAGKDGCRMAQLVKHGTLRVGSGHDLTVRGLEPQIGLCTDRGQSLHGTLSLPLPGSFSLSLSK